MKKKVFKWILCGMLLVVCVASSVVCWVCFGGQTSNPHGYATIGDIPAPWGYERVAGEDTAYTGFLRSLPLKARGAKVRLYTGGMARYQSLNYAVVNLPLLSNAEQCADACMRLRAEYLYGSGQYGRIHFQDVNGKRLNYGGGHSRAAFERYLRHVYGVASTFSLSRELATRPLSDMQPGDVFVYPARNGGRYGHAMMVVDVAVSKDGQKAFLLAEGNMPARNIHVVRNFENPSLSPWFMLNEEAGNLLLSVFHYQATDLKHF